MSNRFYVTDNSYVYAPANIEFDGVMSEFDEESGFVRTEFGLNPGMESAVTNSNINVKISSTQPSKLIDANTSLQNLPITDVKISKKYTRIPDDIFAGCYMLQDIYFDGTSSEFQNIGGDDLVGIPSCNIHCSDKTYIRGVEATAGDRVVRHFVTKYKYNFLDCNRNIRQPRLDLLNVPVELVIYNDEIGDNEVLDKGTVNLYAYYIDDYILYSFDNDININSGECIFFNIFPIMDGGGYQTDRIELDVCSSPCPEISNNFLDWIYTGDSKEFDSHIFYKFTNPQDDTEWVWISTNNINPDSTVWTMWPYIANISTKYNPISLCDYGGLDYNMTAIEALKHWLHFYGYEKITNLVGYGDEYAGQEMSKFSLEDMYAIDASITDEYSPYRSLEKNCENDQYDTIEFNGEVYINADGWVKINPNNIQDGVYNVYIPIFNSEDELIEMAELNYYAIVVEKFEKQFDSCNIIIDGLPSDEYITNGIYELETDYNNEHTVSIPEGVVGVKSNIHAPIITLPRSIKSLGASYLYCPMVIYRGTKEEFEKVHNHDRTVAFCIDGISYAAPE